MVRDRWWRSRIVDDVHEGWRDATPKQASARDLGSPDILVMYGQTAHFGPLIGTHSDMRASDWSQ
jgi:hypothetical protein